MLTHLVFFKLHDRAPANRAALRDKLLTMPGRIPQLRGLEAGANIIDSDRAYDVALVTRFASLAELQAYQAHPYHQQEILPYVKQVSASVVAVDFESGEP